jgi:hypothetical protein
LERFLIVLRELLPWLNLLKLWGTMILPDTHGSIVKLLKHITYVGSTLWTLIEENNESLFPEWFTKSFFGASFGTCKNHVCSVCHKIYTHFINRLMYRNSTTDNLFTNKTLCVLPIQGFNWKTFTRQTMAWLRFRSLREDDTEDKVTEGLLSKFQSSG